jgi:hypothetical protein
MLRLLRPSYRFASRYITQAHTLPKIYDTRLDIDPNEERLFKLTHYKMGDYAGYIGNYLHLKANC